MSNFQVLARGLDFSAVLAELDARPELWGENAERINVEGSPFKGTDDIWVRGMDRHLLQTDPVAVMRPHIAEFYPAWEALPSLHSFIGNLIGSFKPVQLGLILITRIPPGGHVAEHVDRGWHPEFYNFKAHLAIRSNAGCRNYSEDEAFTPTTGDVFTFDNLKPHRVDNHGDEDRITAIVCMRLENL